jgi:hypothetical protein
VRKDANRREAVDGSISELVGKMNALEDRLEKAIEGLEEKLRAEADRYGFFDLDGS